MKKKTSSELSPRAKRLRVNAAATKRAKKLPARLRKEIAALAKLKDENIDTSDIREITDAEWAKRKVGPIYRPIKKSISLRLDADVLEWFRARGKGYQTAMNLALREYVSNRR